MPKNKGQANKDGQRKNQLSLSLKLETSDRKHRNVDADDFFNTAEKWLHALKSFAKEQGEQVKWEIVDLRKSSALVEVQPITLKSGRPAIGLVRNWEQGLRQIEKTGSPPSKFTPESLAALSDFVSSVPQNTVVSIGNGPTSQRYQITPLTQRAIAEALTHFPAELRTDYVAHGSIRGRLAVLDSWKPEERSFRLQLPLAPTKPVKCTYKDKALVTELGEGFEGMVEVIGQLKFKAAHPWPYAAEVENIRVLPRIPRINLKDLVGLLALPNGQDSVSFVRSLRDVE
jgi:hypothetical protein